MTGTAKVSLTREFARAFAAGTLIFIALISLSHWAPERLSRMIPMPDFARGHEMLWSAFLVLAASIVSSLIATLAMWFSRSDWQYVLDNDVPIEPGNGSLIVGYGKIAVGAFLGIAGLFLMNVLIAVGGLSLVLLGFGWIASHARDVARYERDLAQWKVKHGHAPGVASISAPDSEQPPA